MRAPRLVLLALMIPTLLTCERKPTGPLIGDGELSILFIGNSLTATNELPALVATIAESVGHSIAFGSIAPPNFSLEDHWNTGTTERIREARADVVVMQQGPSTLPENQEHLRIWAQQLAAPIREAGGSPALFMVWPSKARFEFFDAVRESYQGAAQAVNGTFLPAGETWRTAWRLDPDLSLYGPDDFHPSLLGSLAAALTIYAVLFEDDVSDLPSRLLPSSEHLSPIELDPETAALLYQAVDETVASFSRTGALLPAPSSG